MYLIIRLDKLVSKSVTFKGRQLFHLLMEILGNSYEFLCDHDANCVCDTNHETMFVLIKREH